MQAEMTIDVREVLSVERKAGQAILDVYATEFSSEEKNDCSPLTVADMRSHEIIINGLRNLWPDIPVVSEEAMIVPFEERRDWERFWLVDPLDGTKEFIKKNGEFTINIALIVNEVPVLGAIMAPAFGLTYWSSNGVAWKRDANGRVKQIRCSGPNGDGLTVVKSRSHLNTDTRNFLSQVNVANAIEMGSSLKFCLIAEGKAHLYARLAPMMEWDIAAGVSIVEAAGGRVTFPDSRRVRFNSENMKIPGVVASGPVIPTA